MILKRATKKRIVQIDAEIQTELFEQNMRQIKQSHSRLWTMINSEHIRGDTVHGRIETRISMT